MVHVCINDTALPYYLQCFQKALDLQHMLCNTDLHMYSQLDLSRHVELPEHLQTARKALAAAPLGLCIHNVVHVSIFLCGNTWAELWGQ